MNCTYTTKPRHVEAVYWDGDTVNQYPIWVLKGIMSPRMPENTPGAMQRVADTIHIGGPDGLILILKPGEWLVRHDNGAFQIYPDADFKKTYEPAPQPA